MSESIARFKRPENQIKNLNWKKYIGGEMRMFRKYQYGIRLSLRKMATDWPKQLAGLIKQFNWTWTRSPVATIQHTVNTSLKQPTT